MKVYYNTRVYYCIEVHAAFVPNIVPVLNEILQVSSHGRFVFSIHVDQVEVAGVVNNLHDIRKKQRAGEGGGSWRNLE